MKTTVEILDALLDAAREAAASEGTTVRALIETGLRREIQKRKRRVRFRLRRASFKGRGLRPEVRLVRKGPLLVAAAEAPAPPLTPDEVEGVREILRRRRGGKS